MGGDALDHIDMLFQAEKLIKDLIDHEGAEGFSLSTKDLITAWETNFKRYTNSS